MGISVLKKVKTLSNSQRLIHAICAGKSEFFGLLLWKWNTEREGRRVLGPEMSAQERQWLEAISCRDQGASSCKAR